jgi:hypothetical protein
MKLTNDLQLVPRLRMCGAWNITSIPPYISMAWSLGKGATLPYLYELTVK